MLLQKIRDHAHGWFAYTIIGLLIIPFAVWGINYYFEGGGPMDAAVVGDSKITLQEFQRAYQQQRQRMQAMLGGSADPALLEGGRLKQDVLRQLIDERVLNQLARDQGMRIGDRQLHDAILALPVFRQSGGFYPGQAGRNWQAADCRGMIEPNDRSDGFARHQHQGFCQLDANFFALCQCQYFRLLPSTSRKVMLAMVS